MSFTPTIGLEVHAELKTKSKMFCGCTNNPHHGEPNAYTCPVCLAHPGTLPVPNEAAIEKVLIFGEAVGAAKATYTEFDRKNYFYPDIPKAYQISQYAFPFLTGGELAGVALTRVHLEEDTARSQHDQGKGSLVDYNRAGVPLMELVTEPVIHDATTAGAFARELQLLLRTLNISDAQMEQGEMRVEANISVSDKEGELGTKVEVKNLNSFRSVESAIKYEIERQTSVLQAGGTVSQETRGWDEVKLKTFVQRSKETAKDYRYFPDPDIPKIDTSKYKAFNTTLLSEKIPKLPNEKREFYKNLGLTSDIVEQLISDIELDRFVSKLLLLENFTPSLLKLGLNYLLSDGASLRASGLKLESVTPEAFLELMEMLEASEINSRVAKDLLPEIFGGLMSPKQVAKERNLLQLSSASELLELVQTLIAENPAVAAEFKAGKESSLQFLVGQGMKKTRGTANPSVLSELLIKELKS